MVDDVIVRRAWSLYSRSFSNRALTDLKVEVSPPPQRILLESRLEDLAPKIPGDCLRAAAEMSVDTVAPGVWLTRIAKSGCSCSAL